MWCNHIKVETVFNMLTNVGEVRVIESIKERRENLCSFMLFGTIL
jgi:hypothetical protein